MISKALLRYKLIMGSDADTEGAPPHLVHIHESSVVHHARRMDLWATPETFPV